MAIEVATAVSPSIGRPENRYGVSALEVYSWTDIATSAWPVLMADKWAGGEATALGRRLNLMLPLLSFSMSSIQGMYSSTLIGCVQGSHDE